ncbi:hypothetical protein MTP04_22250 [Lysinibacillus sp. PLM2]|nr:hypothetical protein MTP04_22250 [Lysinibacillus sp. PLM2]
MKLIHDFANLIHRHIILDLTMRTLEHERKHLNDLKMKAVFDLWMDAKIKELHEEFKNIKSQLGKQGIKIQEEKRLDENFTQYDILARGMLYERKYANVALHNWCQEELKRLLGLEYRTTEDAHKKPS